MFSDLKARFLNLHSLEGIGGALVGFGALEQQALDAVIGNSNGNIYVAAAGILLFTVAKILRAA